MKGILKFKHWQLFLLIVIPGAWKSPGISQEIVNCLGGVTFFIWIYAIGVYGQEKIISLSLPPVKNFKLFKANIYLMPVLIVGYIFFIYLHNNGEAASELDLPTILMMPLILYLFYAVFQTTIFACKVITTLELKKEAKLSDYFLNFLLMCMLIAGIWILQPRITKLIADEPEDANLISNN